MSSTVGDHTEAWKAVTDFAKTIVSLASGVLTVLIGYYVTSGFVAGHHVMNYVAPGLLTLAVLCGIFGFGRAIRAISKGGGEVSGIRFCNVSVLFLLAGVISSAFVRTDEPPSLVRMVSIATKAVSVAPLTIDSNSLVGADLTDGVGVVRYRYRCGIATATVSAKDERVTGLQLPSCPRANHN